MFELPIAGGGRLRVAPSKIIAVGLNYRDHVAESRVFDSRPLGVQSEPALFTKTPNVLIGPDECIVLPAVVAEYGLSAPRTDHEAELALFIGRRCKRVPAESALEYVLGFTCFNDVSQRDIQKLETGGWWRGKSFDTFGPIGPIVVPAALLGDPQTLAIECRVNGTVRQRGSTADMIFSVAELVAFISRNLTLEAGDVVITGTPAGVGPLVDGDTVEVEIERIGVLRNRVRAETVEP
jgi:2-keto-4-pentenoate hydratase/2-oxohepta-3-ene-1,7-dioic acid hydratase in catechol pathway